MPHWQRYLAITVAIALAFAAGLFVQSVFGSAHIPPFSEATVCSSTDSAACQSARSTAVIAWWTRLDTIFSLFTALAAFFAFMAYIQAKRQADTNDRALRHAIDRSQRETLYLASEKRAQIEIIQCQFGAEPMLEEAGRFLNLSAELDVINSGPTIARDVSVSGFAEVRGKGLPETRSASFAKPMPFGDIETGETAYRFIDAPTRIPMEKAIVGRLTIRMEMDVQWRDFAGILVSRRFHSRFHIAPEDHGLVIEEVRLTKGAFTIQSHEIGNVT